MTGPGDLSSTSNAKRIVSLMPSATEIVAALGLADQLVGISHQCNWPPSVCAKPRLTRSNLDQNASSAQIDTQVKSMLMSRQPMFELDAKLLANVAPEVIITQAQCEVCAVGYDDVRLAIEQSESLCMTQVLALNPESLDDVLDDIDRIGAVAGTTETASVFRRRLQQRIDRVTQDARPSHSLRTLVLEWTDPLMVAGHWTPQLVQWAGGHYGLVDAGQPSRCVSWNDLGAFSPEVLIVAPCGLDFERAAAEARALAQRPEWGSLPAVRADRVYPADGGAYFSRAGPRLVDGLEFLAKWLRSAAQ